MDAALNLPASEPVEDIEIHLLLEALYRRYHYDFRHYARASIKRRLRQARLPARRRRTACKACWWPKAARAA